MKNLKSTLIATALVLGTFTMGNASALTVSNPGINSSNVNVVVKDGIATLFGSTDSAIESHLAEREVSGTEGVERVINLLTYN